MKLAKALAEELIKLGWDLTDYEDAGNKCLHCDDELKVEFQFCPKCGTKINKTRGRAVEELNDALEAALRKSRLCVSYDNQRAV